MVGQPYYAVVVLNVETEQNARRTGFPIELCVVVLCGSVGKSMALRNTKVVGSFPAGITDETCGPMRSLSWTQWAAF